ncbi:MAG: N-acetylmuramoyl-L-alanine amidase [bacterium]
MKFKPRGVNSANTQLTYFLFIILLLTFLPLLSYTQDSNWERKIKSHARKMGGDFYFVNIQEIAKTLNARTYYSNKVHKAILYLGEEKITVTAYNPFVLVGQNVVQMPINTKYSDGEIWVPVKFFLPILNNVILASKGNYANGKGLYDFVRGINITGAQVEEKANGTLIRVKTTKEFDKSNLSTRYSRKWLYLDILNGRIDEERFQSSFDKGLVSNIVPVQLDQMVQLSFQLKKDISGQQLEITQYPNEIWLSIPTSDNLSPKLLERLKAEREKWSFDKVVIDPGHGGRDPGAIGSSGVYEKDVVLRIAKKLKKMLEKKLKLKVVMTRETDKFVPLKERTQLANKVNGKLFISIHANSNRNPRLRGATTYFLGPAKSEESLEVARRENAVIRYENSAVDYAHLSDENFILAHMAQNDYNKESQDLAAIVQKELKKRSRIEDRGVKQAGYYVLVGASMPNILIETAFISNKKEERLLKSSSFQQKVAEAIYESVKKFKEIYDWELQADKL